MRQGQQNRRGRGRGSNNNNNNNNNNRNKNQNPLTRSFESNGPDVKIRGTPAHVAEKYITLARDALSSSDPVLAENYLQHAEHYNRIIMTYREQQVQQVQQNGDGPNGNGRHVPSQQPQPAGHEADAYSEDATQAASVNVDAAAESGAGAESEPPPSRARSSQPREPRAPRGNARPRRAKPANADGGAAKGRSSDPENFGAEADQPEFLRRPVRRRTRTTTAAGEGDQPVVESASTDDAGAE